MNAAPVRRHDLPRLVGVDLRHQCPVDFFDRLERVSSQTHSVACRCLFDIQTNEYGNDCTRAPETATDIRLAYLDGKEVTCFAR
jgi:hypothetical protein